MSSSSCVLEKAYRETRTGFVQRPYPRDATPHHHPATLQHLPRLITQDGAEINGLLHVRSANAPVPCPATESWASRSESNMRSNEVPRNGESRKDARWPPASALAHSTQRRAQTLGSCRSPSPQRAQMQAALRMNHIFLPRCHTSLAQCARPLALNSSDPRMMAIVTIGLDYGADVDRARKILNEVAEAHPLVREVVGCPVAELSGNGVMLSLRA
jgi:hypothetical protein